MDLIDPEDGLPASAVGAWTLEKHERLRRYIDAAHGARGKYSKRTYIDLYCGPARSRIYETGAFIDGSPLVAFNAAAMHGDQFTDFYLADQDQSLVDAAASRLRAKGANVHTYVGDARETADRVLQALDRDALHLAFLDPYNLRDLPFTVIEKLAARKRIDLLIHISSMDLKRDLHIYLKPDSKVLDEFAPGWRKGIDTRQRPELIRQRIFEHWRALLIERLGISPNERVEEVLNSKNTDLYWLVFVARHKLAHKLWEAISNVSPQGRLL